MILSYNFQGYIVKCKHLITICETLLWDFFSCCCFFFCCCCCCFCCSISKYKRLTFICVLRHFWTELSPPKKWELWNKPALKKTYPWNTSKPINAGFWVKYVWSNACCLPCQHFKWRRDYTSCYLRTNCKSWPPDCIVNP